MARKKLPSYPPGTRVHIKWATLGLDCPGVVVEETPAAEMWLVDIGDARGRTGGDLVAVVAHDIVGTLPADDSVEAIKAWLHPETAR